MEYLTGGRDIEQSPFMEKRMRDTIVRRCLLGFRFLVTVMVMVDTVYCWSPELLVLGLGRVGRVTAEKAKPLMSYTALVREPFRPNEVSWEDMDRIQKAARSCTHVLVTLPANTQYEICELVASEVPRGTWVGVISTTGVYGNHNGEWVNEESECRSNSPYIHYENDWRERTKHCKLRIFRCSGIYGSTTSALHTLYQNGRSVNESTNPTNRIHLEDLTDAVLASMNASMHRDAIASVEIYNLSDNLPATRAQVMDYASNLFASVGIRSSMLVSSVRSNKRGRRRASESKRVDNTKMKQELLASLKYPTFKEGLIAVLNDRSNPWWR